MAAFGWVVSSHVALYPAILVIPVCSFSFYLYSTILSRCPKTLILKANYKTIKLFRERCFVNCLSFQVYPKLMMLLLLIILLQVIFLLGYGPDSPPRKLFSKKNPSKTGDDILLKQSAQPTYFSWASVVLFFLWASIFASCVLFLCGLYMKEYGGLQEMIQRYIHTMQIFNTLFLFLHEYNRAFHKHSE